MFKKLMLTLLAAAFCSAQAAPLAGLAEDDQVMAWTRQIYELGVKRPGRPGLARTEDYMAARFREMGLKVEYQAVPIEAWDWEEDACSVTFWDAAGKNPVRLGCTPLVRSPAVRGLKGGLARFEDPMDQTLLKDKAVLFEMELDTRVGSLIKSQAEWINDPAATLDQERLLLPYPMRALANRQLFKLLRFKPLAVLVTPVNYLETEAFWGNHVSVLPRMPNMNRPMVWLGRAEGEKARLLMEAGYAQVSVNAPTRVKKITVRNVLGYLAGASENTVIISAHLDGPFASAVQTSFPLALLLAQARYWSMLPQEKRPFSLVFAATNASLYSSEGMRIFSLDQALMDRTVLAVHLENLGQNHKVGPGGRLEPSAGKQPVLAYVSQVPALDQAFKKAVTEQGLGPLMMARPDLYYFRPATDAGVLFTRGAPVVQLISNPVYIFTPEDGLDKVDKTLAAPLGRMVIALVEALRGQTPASMRGQADESSRTKAGQRQKLLQAFDADGDGVLNQRERRELLKYLREKKRQNQ